MPMALDTICVMTVCNTGPHQVLSRHKLVPRAHPQRPRHVLAALAPPRTIKHGHPDIASQTAQEPRHQS